MAKKKSDGPSGLIVVDKPAGGSSHAVVSRMRRLAETRKVGHAGTLDPMATGVLILGINKATKLLTWIVGESKAYTTVMRLGLATITDDAEGDVTSFGDTAQVTDKEIQRIVAEKLTGDIMQVPSSVSAIKINGVRSYNRVRSGEEVELEARPITVHGFEVEKIERKTIASSECLTGEETPADLPSSLNVIDVTATVSCSSGTYIRALARDLGAELGVGAHLTQLRRTRVGEIRVEDAYSLEALEELREAEQPLPLVSLEDAAARLFAVRHLTADEATDISNGRRITPSENITPKQGSGSTNKLHASTEDITAAYAPNGVLVALLENTKWKKEPVAAPVLVFEAGKNFSEVDS